MIISIGLYVVLWGKATEEIEEVVGSLESPTTKNVPLLQSQSTKRMFKRQIQTLPTLNIIGKS